MPYTCEGCGNTEANRINRRNGQEVCNACSPNDVKGKILEYDGNRRINKEYLPELGMVVSERNKKEVEAKFGVNIINKPIDRSYVKEKTEKLKSLSTPEQRKNIRKNKYKELDKRYKRKV